ncbi:hypothetical protein OIU77_031069 [Salix suchowensis]|uniref:Pentatricopeptide repeat-containing protein n=1 Tax=Salix suchowensis TaxID=1278906 RepID=A0ABQ9BG17_9ROSI|nr:hypothetical protein OIU77_031069 [Salix suchowensis]
MVALPGFKPNAVTVLSVLQACMQSQDLVFGMEVHRFVVDNKVELNVLVCNALIGLYAKCGSLDYARELFDEMSGKDEVTYGAIISGYMAHGVVDKGMELFREMKSRALSTWNAVISGLVQNNRHEGAVDLVREMQGLGFKPNAVTLSSVLPALSYFSNLKGGKEMHGFAVKNGYDRNIYVATAIIDTYAKLGFLFGNTGNYAIMANLYSRAGKWKEADEDTSNEKALGIYAMLGGFSGLMEEEGNVLEDLEKVAVYG